MPGGAAGRDFSFACGGPAGKQRPVQAVAPDHPARQEPGRRRAQPGRWLIALLVLGTLGFPNGARGESAELTTVAQVRALSEQEARRGMPVRLRGVFVGEADPEGIAFVIADGAEGLYVQGPAPLVAGLARGDLLEITGQTDPGGFAPYVVAKDIRKTGTAPVPEPTRLTLDRLNAGGVDAKWVEVTGIVRSLKPKEPGDVGPPPPGTRYEAQPRESADKVKMKLASGGADLIVQINRALNPEEYVDAEVRVRGLCFNLHNRNRQFVRPFVQVPNGVDLVIERPPPADPFGGEPSPVASLLSFEQLKSRLGHRVYVRGTVIHHQAGAALWLRDGAHSLRVETTQPEQLQPGDEVDVAGFPARGEYSAVLEDAIFRKRSSHSPLQPSLLTDSASALRHDADLIQLQGMLTEVRRFPDSVVLLLEWQQSAISARMHLPGEASVPSDWLPGSRVVVSGVCSVITDDGGPLGGLWLPRSFQLLLRSPSDLTVIQAPPWWNAERLAWVLSGVLVVAVGAVALVMLASKRRLREQEHRRAMAEAEFSAILSERNRVAREIHDTLSQGLGAISVHLELARRYAGEISAQARQHLATAHQLARTSLAEARVSIWNMRSQVLERCDLADALGDILQRLASGTSAAPSMRVEGTRRRLPPVVENNLLRIGQEAITNAVKHAQASHITLTLGFDQRVVRLVVEDDGIGFTENPQPTGEQRSFGLIGIRERVNILNGQLEIQSRPGEGTRISVSVAG